MHTNFSFNRLSTELALEVISFAAQPEVDCLSSIYGRRGTYDNALALAKVSYSFRRAVMPHILRTVVLSTSQDVHFFIQALLRQCWFRRHFPHLVLDYKHYVCRLWCTESVEVLHEGYGDFETTLGFDLLYDLLCEVKSLGLGIHSFHLLLNSLVLKASPPESPLLRESLQTNTKFCSRITFAGPFFRWGPVTSTTQGIRFLTGITHLTLWITDCTVPLPNHPRIPSWVNAVPFGQLENLVQLEILLVPVLSEEELDQVGYYGEYYSPHPLEVLVLTHCSSRDLDGWARGKGGQPRNRMGHVSNATKSSAKVIEEWLRSTNPLAHGVVWPLYGIPRTATLSSHVFSSWESHFLEGRSGHICYTT